MAKFIVCLKSSIIVDAVHEHDALEQVENVLGEVRERNQGGMEDEILAHIEAVRAEPYEDEED